MALRRSVRDFATYLGVSARMVSNWEAGGREIVPRPFNQQSLDIALYRADMQERERFAHLLAGADPAPVGLSEPKPELRPQPVKKVPPALIVQKTLVRDDMRRAMASRDLATMYRILGRHGISQRQIAALTEQSQSEISEILAGRRVGQYDLLVRIADGLQIPRGYMGLSYSGAGPEVRG